MTDFIKYNSIENHYNQSFIDKISREVDGDMRWISQQKIHGTNFQVIITKDGVSFAKRTSALTLEESFFGYQQVMKQDYLVNAFSSIQSLISGEVRLFGELAGDGIQSNTPYGEKDFYLFDVMVGDKMLDPMDCIDFAKAFCLKIAPIVKIGELQDLLDISPEFETITPFLSQNYESEDNTSRIIFTEAGKGNAEGFVIKPLTNTTLKNGSRVIIKVKSASHTEKKFVKKVKVRKEVEGKDQDIIDTLAQYITKSRILNVLSHGDVVLTDKTFGKVAGLTLKDILQEQSRENEGVNLMSEAFDPAFVNKTLVGIIIKEVVVIWQETK